MVCKQRLFSQLEFATIKVAADVLGLKPQMLSNFYHRLIKPRAALRSRWY